MYRREFWGLVTLHGIMELGQLWFRWWLVAWRYHATIWTSVDKEKNYCVRTWLNKFGLQKLPLKEKHLKCKVFCSDLNISVHCLRQQCLRCAGSSNLYFSLVYFFFGIWFPTNLQCWRSVVEPEMYLLGLFEPRALWGSWPVTLHADQAPVPLMVFISCSGFNRGLGCFGLGCARLIMGRFCTRRDCYTVVACARFRCDCWGTCWAGARQILVRFRVWSAYRWWDRRQSCEICTCTLILMTKISFYLFVFVLNLCCSLVQLCHVMLAINCTELNWIELKRLRKQPSKQMLCKFSGKN